MIRYLIVSFTAQVRQGRTLFLLSVFGVALGVASVLSVQILNQNALGAFEGSVRAISGDADFSIRGGDGTVDERLFPKVLAQPGVADAWPVYRLEVALVGEDPFYLDLVGLDLLAPRRLPWAEAPPETAAPLAVPGWVAVTPQLAERFGWQPGDGFEVTSGSRRVRLEVGAIVDFRRLSPLAGSRLAVLDIAEAQHLFGQRGRLHQIDLVVDEKTDPARVRSALVKALGPELRIETPEERRDEAAVLLRAFRLNLTSLSLISVVVGGFLVYSTTLAALTRRRAELGLMRSIGATRGQVLTLLLVETGILGLLGVAIGVPIGYAAAAGNVDRVSATLSNLYLLEGIETLELSPSLFLLAALIGLGGALGGALLPALDLGRRDTRDLLAAYTLHEPVGAKAGRLFAAGCLVILSGVAVYGFFLRSWRPGGFVVGIALLIGMPLMAPWTLSVFSRLIRARHFGLAYGARALGVRLQTTAFAVAALAVAVSMLIGISLMIGSFRRTVDVWLGGTLKADVYITTESWSRARAAATLDPALVDDVTRMPGVAHVDRLRQRLVYAGDRQIAVGAVDMGLPVGLGRFELMGGDPTAALAAVRDEGAVLISEPLALKDDLGAGDRLRLPAEGARVELPIAGVFRDYSSERGAAVMDLSTMDRLYGPGPVSNLALYLDPGGDADEVVRQLKARYPELPLIVRSNRELRAEVFRIFDQTFAITRLLQGMSLLIAVSGITLSLIVLARERVSELALYRALGARRRQIFRVFVGKGLGLALLGLLLGSGGGVALAMVLIFLINRAYFGWTIAVHWPWSALAENLILILVASVVASLYPALRASRTPATELSRENL